MCVEKSVCVCMGKVYKCVYGKLVKWKGIMCGSLCVGDKKDTFEECVREYVRVCGEWISGR